MKNSNKAITPELVKEADRLLSMLGNVCELLIEVSKPTTKVLPELFYIGNKTDDFGYCRSREGKTLLKHFPKEAVEEIRTATIRILKGERFILEQQLIHLGVTLPPSKGP